MTKRTLTTYLNKLSDEYWKFFNEHPDMLAIITASGRFRAANPAWSHELGFPQGHFHQALVVDFVYQDDRDKFLDTLTRLERDEVHSVYFRLNTLEGLAPWFSLCGSIFNVEGLSYISIRNVDHVIRLQDELAQFNARFRAMLDYNIDVIHLSDEWGRFLYINRAVKFVLGYEPRELIGMSAPELIHPDGRDKFIEIRSNVLLTHPGKTFKTFLNVRRKDGSYVWIEAVITNLLNDPSVHAVVTNWRTYPQTVPTFPEAGGAGNGFDSWLEVDNGLYLG